MQSMKGGGHDSGQGEINLALPQGVPSQQTSPREDDDAEAMQQLDQSIVALDRSTHELVRMTLARSRA